MGWGKTDVAGETVLPMRRLLKDLVRDEPFGHIQTVPGYNPDVTIEVQTCNQKVIDLTNYINDHNFDSINSNETLRQN